MFGSFGIFLGMTVRLNPLMTDGFLWNLSQTNGPFILDMLSLYNSWSCKFCLNSVLNQSISIDWGGPAKWCFSSWSSAAAEKMFHLSRVTYKVIMAQFDLRPKLDGSLQITKFCVMIFCGSIATWFQPLPNHGILRCARMLVSMSELIRRLKPCQKMSSRSWLGTDPDSTCMMCRRDAAVFFTS